MVFDQITKYNDMLDDNNSGEWIIDRTSKGTPEDPIHFPHVLYSEETNGFASVFSQGFSDYDYVHTLTMYELVSLPPNEIDPVKLDTASILALLTKIVRGERFCEGLLKEAIEDGTVHGLLCRLREIDKEPKKATLKDAVYGLAVGDAMGVPGEFQVRESYHIDSMVGGGIHNQQPGTWSDDTSMTLATCESIRQHARIDLADRRKQFCSWLYEGKYTVDGKAFDCGNTVAEALSKGRGCTGKMSNGNGSLMRIIPLAFTSVSDEEIGAVSAITHAPELSKQACLLYIKYAQRLLVGCTPIQALSLFNQSDKPFDRIKCINRFEADAIKSSGYAIDTLEAALWCLTTTDTYSDCILKAVNLGNDTDTIAAVAGGLAGICYGYRAIPKEWINELRGKDVIDDCLFL